MRWLACIDAGRGVKAVAGRSLDDPLERLDVGGPLDRAEVEQRAKT